MSFPIVGHSRRIPHHVLVRRPRRRPCSRSSRPFRLRRNFRRISCLPRAVNRLIRVDIFEQGGGGQTSFQDFARVEPSIARSREAVDGGVHPAFPWNGFETSGRSEAGRGRSKRLGKEPAAYGMCDRKLSRDGTTSGSKVHI